MTTTTTPYMGLMRQSQEVVQKGGGAGWLAEIAVTVLRGPDENRLPGAHTSNALTRSSLVPARPWHGAQSGTEPRRNETAAAYAAHQLGRATRQLPNRAGHVRLIEEDRRTDTIAAVIKMNNTRNARQVIAEARDLLGGNGILPYFRVMRRLG